VTARFAPPARQARQLEDLYGELSRSVYVIVAGPTATDIKLRRNLAQGSAVAVDSSTLITNCHIVDSRPLVYLVNQDGLVPLAIAAARRSGDTCILRAQKDILSAVARIRPFDSLKVGEGVMAIGSPHGFEATLTVGIVSQLRRRGEQRLVQTTAPISGGSSGGGLFDYGGNLVGITTFSIRDAENLNFAISVDEYLR
jgi:S1-C subfamily serine protease